jgi:hypothetical protein
LLCLGSDSKNKSYTSKNDKVSTLWPLFQCLILPIPVGSSAKIFRVQKLDPFLWEFMTISHLGSLK